MNFKVKVVLFVFLIIIVLIGGLEQILKRIYRFDILFTLTKKPERVNTQDILSNCSTQVIVVRCPNQDYVIYHPELIGLDAAYTLEGDRIYSYTSMGGFRPTAIYAIRKIQRKTIGCDPITGKNLCRNR